MRGPVEIAIAPRAGIDRHIIGDRLPGCRTRQPPNQRLRAFDNKEAENRVSCIGAGIQDEEGKLVAGLSLSAPSHRLDKAWVAEVKQTADQISYAIGFRPAGRAADVRSQAGQSVEAAANSLR